MSKRTWIIFIGVVVVLFSGIIWYARSGGINVSMINQNAVVTEKKDSEGKQTAAADNVFGNPKAKIVLIEYGDYQCPGCGSAHSGIKTISEQYKDHIAFVFRNLPLTNIHPNALAAATAAEAAGKQGKYWEMHNKLYELQSSWESASINDRAGIFEQYARDIGLSISQYQNDLKSAEVTFKIGFDRALAVKAGVDSTPTFILNGKKQSSDMVEDIANNGGEKLRAAIDALIKKNGGVPPATPVLSAEQ